MALEQKKLLELKEKLLAQKKQLEAELSRIAKPANAEGDYTTNFSDIGSDEDENASEVEEYTDNLALEDVLEKQLRDTNDALEDIGNGTYGVCKNCKQEISIDRLMAYPAARSCINCK
jgi:RNA polymerase-binding protein DksA